jgi:hypothetical protein
MSTERWVGWRGTIRRTLVTVMGALLVAPAGLGAPLATSDQAMGATAFQVATDDTSYALCGRVFPDPHAYWPSPAQTPARSPFAKGNAPCAATDFLSYAQMVEGATYLETIFPDFVEFYRLEDDFGDGDDCDASTDPRDYCSAGLPRQGVSADRERSDLYMLRVTDERVSDEAKKFFTFPLSIHGIERAGAEAGVRAAEDLATWAACEAELAPASVSCAKEGAIPHALLETTPDASVTAGEALAGSAIYFVFANPDGWRRGDPDNGARFFQRYNGNGVDMNRDWPTIGYTFEPYTPWSEPETRAFGEVMKEIRDTWDGGIDLHGQLIDRAFSFTLMGASERDYAKDQRILQTVKGAWADAEARLAWSPTIKPNDAPDRCSDTGGDQPCDERMYGVQWGTVWDTIDYTVTGSLGDWIDSPLGLGADGIDNEMSLSHLSNCGVGSCYLPDAEQLHVDGNKSLIYSMVNFTLLPEDSTFDVPAGTVGYVFDPTVVTDDGGTTPPPTDGLAPQEAILDVSLDPTNGFTHEFEVAGPSQGVYNGGVEGKATFTNVSGVSQSSALTSLVLEQYRPDEPEATGDDGCSADDANWEVVNSYFNQSFVYLQAGQAVHGNLPLPGRWRICLTGGLATHIAASGGRVDLDITFTTEKAWEDPGQIPYSATNMEFFRDLAATIAPAELVPVEVDDVLSGAADLDAFSSVVVADDPFPGYSEPVATGPAQAAQQFSNPGLGTVPCAYDGSTQVILPPTCVQDFEFDVDPAFNNQQLAVTLTVANPGSNDWDLYLERRSSVTGEWSEVGKSTTPTGDEQVTILSPLVGHYRARVLNWAADPASGQSLDITFSNEYAGPPIEESERTDEELAQWAATLRGFVEGGGNLVLTDGAIRNVAYMDLVSRTTVNTFSVYAGYIGFTADGGATDTYADPLAFNVNQPGAAEGPNHRHQTYEPVPIGFAIQNPDGGDFNASPVWSVDQVAWEEAGGRTAGTTTADQATLGELAVGSGVVRIIGPLLPMPTQRYYHPFGLANYAVTYTGYQVLQNALQWERPALPDLALTDADLTLSAERVRGGDEVTITAEVRNIGDAGATDVAVRFEVDGEPLGDVQSIATIEAGSSDTASVVWSTRQLNGEHTITVTADPDGAITELDEANNVAERTVTVRGNKVQNGSFEEASEDGSAPAAWSASSTDAGTTEYANGGSDGDRSVSISGTGGSVALSGLPSWTSEAIEVSAGEVLSLRGSVSTDGMSSAPSLGLAYLGPAGDLLQTVTVATAALRSDGFAVLDEVVTVPAGVTSVQVVLAGFALTDLQTQGTVTFDDIGLYAE